MPSASRAAWDALDADGAPAVKWIRKIEGKRLVTLLGAFDPPTNAHVALLVAAARHLAAAPVLCLTKTLLARSEDSFLRVELRLELLDRIAVESGFGFVVANRGTYIDVGDALHAEGYETSFVIGSDKLVQLADPAFYPDAERGAARTFDELQLIVVPRPDKSFDRPGLVWLDPDDVFDDPKITNLSATEVRRRLVAGQDVSELVPPAVAMALRGYTSAK